MSQKLIRAARNFRYDILPVQVEVYCPLSLSSLTSERKPIFIVTSLPKKKQPVFSVLGELLVRA